jgi:hypothetical protein
MALDNSQRAPPADSLCYLAALGARVLKASAQNRLRNFVGKSSSSKGFIADLIGMCQVIRLVPGVSNCF